MKMIYIVVGTTGEYSDRTDWNVCAYREEQKAEEHARNATLRAVELKKTRIDRYRIEKGANEFDPNMQMDYTGTEYTVASVELRD